MFQEEAKKRSGVEIARYEDEEATNATTYSGSGNEEEEKGEGVKKQERFFSDVNKILVWLLQAKVLSHAFVDGGSINDTSHSSVHDHDDDDDDNPFDRQDLEFGVDDRSLPSFVCAHLCKDTRGTRVGGRQRGGREEDGEVVMGCRGEREGEKKERGRERGPC